MAASTTATWGSAPSLGESTTDPSDECEEFESTLSDDDEFPIGPDRANDQEPSPEEEDQEVDITGEDFDELLRRLHRRRRRPLRRNPLGMANFTCRYYCPLGARSLP